MKDTISPLQAMVDGWSEAARKERANRQMTLGKMIAALEAMPPESDIERVANAHSYRGYYSDLAFEPKHGSMKASHLLAACRAAMGQVFQGYKGGEYMMGANTPVWLAEYGCCGQKIMGFAPNGLLQLASDD